MRHALWILLLAAGCTHAAPARREQVADVAHGVRVPRAADLVGRAVVDGHDPEAALEEAAILRERRPDLARADDDHALQPLCRPEATCEGGVRTGRRANEP